MSLSRDSLRTFLFSSTLVATLRISAAFAGEPSGMITQFIGDNQFTTQINELTKKAGIKGAALHQPWSGTYWPLHAGSIANPYDEGGNGWLNNTARLLRRVEGVEKHFLKRMTRIRANINHLSDDELRELAPSEKYDLYLGDRDFSLTYALWNEVIEQLKLFKKVELWEGSCQGWASASAFVPRPGKLIRVMSLDGKYLIPFYPDDLKGLVTLLWANSTLQTGGNALFMGKRCKSEHLKYDEANGKVLDDTCMGVNPADLHVALLELMGARKQTFIVNRVNDGQVWNQAVSSYEFRYFNLANGKQGDLAKSVISRFDKNYLDPFAKYRSPKMKSVVGVFLKLNYTSEKDPSHHITEDDSYDRIRTLRLHYDLELDANLNIVGGEWISSEDSGNAQAQANDTHSDSDEAPAKVEPPSYPGFIWKFIYAYPKAFSYLDAPNPDHLELSKLDLHSLQEASKKAANYRYHWLPPIERWELRPQPLDQVVYPLIELSHNATAPQTIDGD